MAYDVILTDIDNTLLDFDAGSAAAIRGVLEHHGLTYSDARLQDFLSLNDRLWKQYERGEIVKDVIFQTRFKLYLALYGVDIHNPLEINSLYAEGLMTHNFLMPHCMEFLDAVRGKYRLYAITNGVAKTQVTRLRATGLDAYFDAVFISEQMGCKKPEPAFFDQVFAAIGPVDKSRCILLGDSLTSDMQGGRNAGVATCLLGNAQNDPRCDYVIGDLLELLPILERP